jgi:hypothetical protein
MKYKSFGPHTPKTHKLLDICKENEILMHNIGKLYQQIKPHKHFTSMEKNMELFIA